MDFFGIGALEFLAILVVILVVMGPDKVPGLARRAGVLFTQARRAINEAQSTLLSDVDLDTPTRAARTERPAADASEERPPPDSSRI